MAILTHIRISGRIPRGKDSRAGFTMIELMTVMVIMAIMMAVAVGAYIDWGRGAGMRGSVLNTQSSLQLARQFAVTHRAKTLFVYDNSTSPEYPNRGFYVVATGTPPNDVKPVSATNYLTEGIEFTWGADSPKYVQFKIDGSCSMLDDSGTPGNPLTPGKIYLNELNRAQPLTETIVITPMTGRSRIEEVRDTGDTGGGGGGGRDGDGR